MSVFRQLQELFFTEHPEIPGKTCRYADGVQLVMPEKRTWWQFWSSDDNPHT